MQLPSIMLQSEYDPFNVYDYNTIVNFSYTIISGTFTPSVAVPFVNKSLVSFAVTTNLKASGELCLMSTSCLLVSTFTINCVLQSSVTHLDHVDQNGFCFANTGCNAIQTYAVDGRMGCTTSCNNALTPGNSWPNYYIANGSGTN